MGGRGGEGTRIGGSEGKKGRKKEEGERERGRGGGERRESLHALPGKMPSLAVLGTLEMSEKSGRGEGGEGEGMGAGEGGGGANRPAGPRYIKDILRIHSSSTGKNIYPIFTIRYFVLD